MFELMIVIYEKIMFIFYFLIDIHKNETAVCTSDQGHVVRGHRCK